MVGQVEKIADLIRTIRPDRIHLNTVVRPPAEDFAAGLPEERLKALTKLFDPTAEVIAEFNADNAGSIAINEESILSMLKRRPCTIEQISKIFNMHVNEMSKYLGSLLRNNQVYTVPEKTSMYYVANMKN